MLNLLPQATIVIKTAAVCDYRPKSTAGQKMKRKGPMTLELEPTPDILKDISAKKGTQILVGFAAETENVLENARQKLVSKNLDAIVVNDVSREGVGFDTDRNAVTIITRDDVVEVPETTKWEVAATSAGSGSPASPAPQFFSQGLSAQSKIPASHARQSIIATDVSRANDSRS